MLIWGEREGYAGKGFPPWRRAGDPSKACSCSVHTHKLPADHSPARSYNDSYCPATTIETMSSPVRMLSDKILMYNNVVIGKKTDPFSLKPHFGRQAFDNHGGILLKKRCEDIKTKVDFEG